MCLYKICHSYSNDKHMIAHEIKNYKLLIAQEILVHRVVINYCFIFPHFKKIKNARFFMSCSFHYAFWKIFYFYKSLIGVRLEISGCSIWGYFSVEHILYMRESRSICSFINAKLTETTRNYLLWNVCSEIASCSVKSIVRKNTCAP